MTDQPREHLLEDPDGAPYPTSVQHFLGRYFPDLEPDDDELVGQDLQAALEAAIAADREHRAEQPELEQTQLDRLVNIYAAGMGSGAATALMQLDIPAEKAQQMGLLIAGRMLEDPATRLMLEDLTSKMWTGAYDAPIQWQSFTAYPSPRNYRDD